MLDAVVVPGLLVGGDGGEFGGADRSIGRRVAEQVDPVARRPIPEPNLAMRRVDRQAAGIRMIFSSGSFWLKN